MMQTKSKIGWLVIILLTVIPVVLWALVQPLPTRWGSWQVMLTSLGQIAGLAGLMLFSLNLILSTRLPVFEDFFGGMNKVYIAHHLIGAVAFGLFVFHPLALAFVRGGHSAQAAIMFFVPGSSLAQSLGIVALFLSVILLTITFFAHLPYEIWRWSHKLLGVAFMFAAVHGLLAASDVAFYPALKIYFLIFIVLGIGSYIYRTVLGRFLVRRVKYMVSEVKILEEGVVELRLIPEKKGIDFSPGQFVFVSFISKTVSDETHPFSISSDPQPSGELDLVIKSEGDYTKKLCNLTVGDKALIEGSFGRFEFSLIPNRKQIWIAGGIGVVPFISMAGDLTKHKDYKVDFYYCVKTEEEAIYLEDFNGVVKADPNFRGFVWVSLQMGRLTGKTVAEMSEGVTDKDIFICGPPPMMAALRFQFRQLKVPDRQIHSEEFKMQ